MIHILSSNSHSIVIGRIDGTYVSQELMKDNKPDLDKLSPLLWFADKAEYVMVSKVVGKSRSIGNTLKSAKQ